MSKTSESAIADDANRPGACLVVNKMTGEQECIFVTPQECANQQGVFQGGPCGPFNEQKIPKEE